MKNRKHADGAADKAGVAGELDDSLGGSLHQQGIAVALVGAQERTQLGRDGDGDVEIRDRQHLGLAIGKPIFGLVGVAFGAGAVFAGVIREHLVGAMITAPEMSAESLGSAREDIGDGTAMRRRHRRAMGP
jgi:hypothetical protein